MADLEALALKRQIRDLTIRVTNLEARLSGSRARANDDEPAASGESPARFATDPEPDEPSPLPAEAATPAPAPRRFRRPSDAGFDIERFVGGKTFAVLGAAAVVVASGLFLKLAYDQGWLGRISDGWKCVLSALFGAALLGVGEAALRRWGRLASMGLTAAGLGVVYASAFAAYGGFHLVEPGVAFAMMAGVVAVGFALSARARRVPVAVLTTLAGYAIPFMLNDAGSVEYVFPAHVLTMLAVALALSARLGRPFGVVRAVAWWCTMLLGTLWALAEHDAHPGLTVAFLAGFWAMTHAELLWSCRRGDRAEGEPEPFDFDELNARPLQSAMRPLVRPMLASFSQTAWTALLGAVAISHGLRAASWLAPGALFVATSVLWIVFAGSLRVLRDPPRTRLEALGAALAAQAGALLLVTASLALTGITESIAGLALGVAAMLASRWLNLRAVGAYALATLTLATLRLLAVDFSAALQINPVATFAGWQLVHVWEVVLTRWTLLAALGAAAWFAGAALLSREQRSRAVRAACVVAGAALVLLGFVSADASPKGLFAAWLVCGVAFALALRPFGRVEASAIALGALTLSVGVWAFAWPPIGWDPATAFALAHPGFLAGLLGIAGLLGLRAATPRGAFNESQQVVRDLAGLLALAVAFTATSAEAARVASIVFVDGTAKYATLTVWWAVFATALIVGGFARREPVVRHIGLALLSVAAGKAVLFDLSEVEPAWRIASFLGVGLFMLGVATGYTRIARAARAVRREDAGAAS